MPFRVIGYDGTAYRSQLLEERKKILPVVTIILYFGTDRHWNNKKNIKSLMEIPEGLDKFVNDYSMQVFEIAWLTEEEIERFQSDFRIVANFFVKKRHKPPVNQITDGLYKVKWICGSIIGLLNCYLLEVFFQLKTNHCSEEYPLLRKESDR